MTIVDILFFCVVFFANIVEAITGFAGTMLAMPPAMLLIGADTAKLALNAVAIFVSAGLTLKNYKHINVKQALIIIMFMSIGTLMGRYIYSAAPLSFLMKFYGSFIIVIALQRMFSKKDIKLNKIMQIIVMICAGIIHGMFLSGGALLVFYAVAVLKNKTTIRATLSVVWLVINSFVFVQEIFAGNVTYQVLTYSAICIPFLILALFVGGALHKKIKQEFFLKLTYILLIISGASLIV